MLNRENNRTDLEEFWVLELLKFTPEFLEKFDLAQRTKRFLEDVGLPLKTGSLAAKTEKHLLIKFYDSFSLIERFLSGEKYHFVFAADPGLPDNVTCIRESDSTVILLDKSDGTSTFINSDIKSFMMFLQIYLENWLLQNRNYELNEAIARNLIKSTITEFNLLDHNALSNSENFWSLILEELGYEYTSFQEEVYLELDSSNENFLIGQS